MDVYKLWQHFISNKKTIYAAIFLAVRWMFESSDWQTDQNLCIQVAQERLVSNTLTAGLIFPSAESIPPLLTDASIFTGIWHWQEKNKTTNIQPKCSPQPRLSLVHMKMFCQNRGLLICKSMMTPSTTPSNSSKRILRCIKLKPLPFCVSNKLQAVWGHVSSCLAFAYVITVRHPCTTDGACCLDCKGIQAFLQASVTYAFASHQYRLLPWRTFPPSETDKCHKKHPSKGFCSIAYTAMVSQGTSLLDYETRQVLH